MLDRECPGLWLAVAAIAMSLFSSEVAVAQDVPVDLELVLAVDISLSMDEDEQRLQRDGYIAAFRNPEIIEAIKFGSNGRIAVTYVEWAGESFQQIVIPWTLIDGADTALTFADKLAAAPIAPELQDVDLRSVDLCSGTVRRQWLSRPSGHRCFGRRREQSGNCGGGCA